MGLEESANRELMRQGGGRMYRHLNSTLKYVLPSAYDFLPSGPPTSGPCRLSPLHIPIPAATFASLLSLTISGSLLLRLRAQGGNLRPTFSITTTTGLPPTVSAPGALRESQTCAC